MDYANITGPDGQGENMGGTQQKVFYASINTFLSIQTPSASPTDPEDLVEITTPHTFKSTFCWLTAYCTQDKGKVDSKIVGETDGKSFEITAEFFVPGSETKAHGFAKMAKNDNFIFLFPPVDAATKGYYQIGTEMFPAKVDPEFSTGTNKSGVRGHIFKVYAPSDAMYIYSGTISLTPAS